MKLVLYTMRKYIFRLKWGFRAEGSGSWRHGMAFSPVVYGKTAYKEGIREAENSREGLGASPRTAENVSLRPKSPISQL